MAKRKRMYVKSVEERMMYRMQQEYKCSILEAWKRVKEFQFHREMRKLNTQI